MSVADPHEFIRRFLMHVLPKGFHRIRHYGLFANGNRAANITRARELLGARPRVVEPEEEKAAAADEPRVLPCPCRAAAVACSSSKSSRAAASRNTDQLPNPR
jgi:hypothetical protein